ncbi:MAG: DNA translocase FtsK [Verrucomicrobiales bacterium]
MERRSPRRQQDEPPTHFETPWGTVGALVLLVLGMAGYLSLVSHDPRDIHNDWPLCGSLATTDRPNEPSNNVIGPVGAFVAGCQLLLFGAAAYLLPTAMVWFGVSMLVARLRLTGRAMGGLALMMISGPGLLSVQGSWLMDWAFENKILQANPGGGLGWILGDRLLAANIGRVGAFLFLGTAYLAGLIMVTGLHPMHFVALCRDGWDELMGRWRESQARRERAIATAEPFAVPPPREMGDDQGAPRRGRRGAKAAADADGDSVVPRRRLLEADDELLIPGAEVAASLGLESVPGANRPARGGRAAKEAAGAGAAVGEVAVQLDLGLPAKPEPKIIDSSERAPATVNRPSLADIRRKAREQKAAASASAAGASLGSGATPSEEFAQYELPDLDLLASEDTSTHKPADKGALLATQQTIIRTLETFGIKVAPGDITRGPTITRYEIYPEEGLRVNRIAALEDDLARTTKAERINILAPIPGKDTVGIEIANIDKVPVPMRELLEDPAFSNGKAKLPLALGKDVYGHTIVGDLASMPHLLVAGATGSGKSVCINSIISSLLFQFTPEQLRFIMIDPKVVEMQHYNDLPHLVIPVVTDPKKTLTALSWVVNEMEARYRVFADVGVRNFEAFNKREIAPKPPTAARSARTTAPPSPAPARAASALARPPAENRVVLGSSFDTTPPAGRSTSAPDELALSAVPDLPDEALHDVENPNGAFLDQPPLREIEQSAFHAHAVRASRDKDDSGVIPDPDRPGDPTADAETVWSREDDFYAEEDLGPKVPDRYPYIVVIIDELADLMQTAPAEIEVAICRIAQKARAAGIHLILATQTPRADVITGVIKANIPCKIAFQVSNALDSRVILDAKGAEKLVGKGDMLYLPPGSAKLIRAQGAFVTDDEVTRIVDFCKGQAKPRYVPDIKASLDGAGDGLGDDEEITTEDEDCYEKCLEVISQENRASTSLLQRRLRLGYTRAARMMDILEMRGIIGPGEGAKPREILVSLGEGED